MTQAITHHSQVFGSPWPGVYGTLIDSTRCYGRHWHDVYGLGLLEHGAQRSASGRGQVDAYAGDLITTNPGEVHDGHPIGAPSRRWRMLYLEPAVLAGMAEGAASAPSGELALTRPVIQDAPLRHALQHLLHRLGLWDPLCHAASVDALACEEALVRTCGLLLQRHADAARCVEASAELKYVRDRLADDPLQPPTLTEMAVMVGLSKFQLLRRFEKAYGLTPYAWLLQQRTERARGLIQGGASLAQAAASCGFADQSHMTRLFARHFGFTPGAWQQAARCGSRPPPKPRPRPGPSRLQ